MKRALVIGLLALAACTLKSAPPNALVACGPGDSCPAGSTCDDGYCVATPGGGGDGGSSMQQGCVTDLSAGEGHSCAVRSDGTVWCWGANMTGQLGDGSYDSSATPVQVVTTTGMTSAVAVAAGYNHTCAIDGSGAVWCWGDNTAGELGDNSTHGSQTPVMTGLTSGAVQITSGYWHSCARLASGGVDCWGTNESGDIGDNTMVNQRNTPVAVALPAGLEIVDLSTADDTACAVGSDQSVWCWGENVNGELGEGSSDYNRHIMPALIKDSAAIPATQVAMSENGGCALTPTSLWCWGDNSQDQLGIDANLQRSGSPVEVTEPEPFVKIAAGDLHVCATGATGTLWCWGLGYEGQLLDNNSNNQEVPYRAYTGVTKIAGGGAHTCVLLASGELVCGGDDTYGQLGDGHFGAKGAPLALGSAAPLGSGATLAPAGYSTCAILSGGTAACWGGGGAGELGAGVFENRGTAQAVGGLSGVTQLAGGDDVNCAIAAGSAVWCWGNGYNGALANGMAEASPDPIQVPLPGPATAISVGGQHACAVLYGGAVWCWGNNFHGEVGNDTTDDQFVPVAVMGISATAIACGNGHTCALLADATVDCWGEDDNDELGQGSATGEGDSILTPIAVAGLGSGITAVAAQGSTTCAVRAADHSLWCWGAGYDGQLGQGTNSASDVPLKVPGTWARVTLGDQTVCAIDTTEELYCWGDDTVSELADNFGYDLYANQSTPTKIALTNVTQVAAGVGQVCAESSAGFACWGQDAWGQVGDGTTNYLAIDEVSLACP